MSQISKLCVIFLLFLTSLAFSQSVKSRLTLSGGFSLPLADFAKTDGSENAGGNAKFGFTGAAEFDLQFGQSGIFWSTSFHYIANDYQTDEAFKWIPDFQLHDTGAYTNYPLLTGLKYEKELGDGFSLFAVGQLGMNLANGPFFGGYVVDDEGNLINVEVEMGSQTTQGFGFGLGFIANKTTTVAFRYFSMGSPQFSSTANFTLGDESHSYDIEWQHPMSVILLTVGYAINFD